MERPFLALFRESGRLFALRVPAGALLATFRVRAPLAGTRGAWRGFLTTFRESGHSWQGGRVPEEALFGPPRPFLRESGLLLAGRQGAWKGPF